jgi:anti-sigma factor RsiW
MNCNGFGVILADFQGGTLSPGERAAAESHLRACDACRRLLAIACGNAGILSEEKSRALTRSIIERTSGSACPRVEEQLCSLVDDELDHENSQLVALHLDYCASCKAVADSLKIMREVLPEMAKMEPGRNFTREVVGATSGWRPFRPGLRTRLLTWWNRLVQRPRFSYEAAYVGTLASVFVFGSPVPPLPGTVLDALRSAPLVQTARQTVSRLLPSDWSRAEAPVLSYARGVAVSASRKEQAFSGSVYYFMKSCERLFVTVLDWQVQTLKTSRQKVSGSLSRLRSNLSSRMSRSKG